jgi:cation transport regulator ChaC
MTCMLGLSQAHFAGQEGRLAKLLRWCGRSANRAAMLHFAYGSNMSCAEMARRCPGAVAIGPAQLDGWRYTITRDGYASIVAAPGHKLHGVLWRLTPRDLAALNSYESLDSGLYRRRWLLVRYADRRIRALVYVGRNSGQGRARPGYQEDIVLPAAHAWGLPAAYLSELARWTPARGTRRAEPGV